jgi:hypothetical protein
MPSGTEPGAAALFATVGSNGDGLIGMAVRFTGDFASRPRHIHATAPSNKTPNAIISNPTRAFVDNGRFFADDLEIVRDTSYPKRPGTNEVYPCDKTVSNSDCLGVRTVSGSDRIKAGDQGQGCVDDPVVTAPGSDT